MKETSPGLNVRCQSSMADVAAFARTIYADHGGLRKYKQILRPYICPLHLLARYVPLNSSVLDVGCGAGLFLTLLAHRHQIRSGLGFDADAAAIRLAQELSGDLTKSTQIRFEHRNVSDNWPAGVYDVVSIIDVMHHVQDAERMMLINRAAERLSEGGTLIYKDIADRPRWMAFANRCHDLIFAGEWVNYTKLDQVIEWARECGFDPEVSMKMHTLWYPHELCVFRKKKSAAKD